MMRTATREAAILVLLSVALGFTYTGLTGRGLFAPPASPPPSTGLQMITLAEAQAALADSTSLFVDSRHPFEFERGHLPRAVNIPLNDLNADPTRVSALSRDRRVIVYCDGAECNSSIEVAARFLQYGFTDVRVFYGGWKEWQAQGLPTERGRP